MQKGYFWYHCAKCNKHFERYCNVSVCPFCQARGSLARCDPPETKTEAQIREARAYAAAFARE